MFLQAGSPAELRAYMAQYPDSRCIAGGTDIMPVQNRENDHEAVFIDISGAAALHRIVSEDGMLSVGAAATFAEIERNALLRQYAPALCLAGGVPSDTKSGHHRRQCGTWEPRSGHPAGAGHAGRGGAAVQRHGGHLPGHTGGYLHHRTGADPAASRRIHRGAALFPAGGELAHGL